MSTVAAFDRPSRTATIAVQGDLAIPDAKGLYDCLKSISRRRDVRTIVLDLGKTERIDGAGMAVVSLGRKLARRAGKKLEIANGTRHKQALELMAAGAREGRGAVRGPRGEMLDLMHEKMARRILARLGSDHGQHP